MVPPEKCRNYNSIWTKQFPAKYFPVVWAKH